MRVVLDVLCTLFDAPPKSSDSMITAAKIRNGSTYFANHLSANDYYAQGERVTGQWLGKGAESLGLSGEVRPEAFEALRVNQRPGSGDRLTPRTKEMRQPTLVEAAQAFREKEGRSGTAQEVANFRLSMKLVSNRVAFFDFQRAKVGFDLAVLGEIDDSGPPTKKPLASHSQNLSVSLHDRRIPLFNASLKSLATFGSGIYR